MTAAPPGVSRAASALAALGHEARLEIFRALVRAGDEGLPVYQIQERLGGIPRSTLSHHLQMLVQAGLVAQRKVGAEVLNRAEFAAMRELVSYLTDECCVDAMACAPGAPTGTSAAAACQCAPDEEGCGRDGP
jgi:ArsR family transcriptional regulator, arsenate/arsenite/antimonite-responsive transcriptional repressor